MAKIFPEHLPESILSDPKKRAEVMVYQAFQKLDDDYRVFYSAAWQHRVKNELKDGEADFIVAHPKMGIIVFEVKGGTIAYDANLDQWTSRSINGHIYNIKDPIAQARESRYSLFEKLRDLPGWDQERFINLGQAVIFPDIEVNEKSLSMDLPRKIIIDNHDLEKINIVVPQIMSYYSSGDPNYGSLGQDRLSILETLLAKSFNLRTSLGVEIDSIEEKLVELTENQMQLLDYLGTRRRAAISGCAGSGKTMLAAEKARRLSKEGFNVLMVCFNYKLGEYLSGILPNISGFTILKLCEDLVKEAGIKVDKSTDTHDYYDHVLPEAAFDAAVALGKKFDAVIVDEGQDFREEYWMLINELIDETNGILYIFYDDNQNLFKGFPINKINKEEPFQLIENCRNTKLIHELVRNYHNEKNLLSSKSPLGFQPEIIYYSGELQLKKKLQSLLFKLINQEHISNHDIVILTPHSQSNTAFKYGTEMGNLILTEDKAKQNNEVMCTSIYKFKGLESKVVIIVEIGPLVLDKIQEIMYVGCSRAKEYLVLMIDENLQKNEMTKIAEFCKVQS